jgi:hypothetical protein
MMKRHKKTIQSLDAMGWHFEPGSLVQLPTNLVVNRTHPNAFIFCCSESRPTDQLARLFGRHCVKIECMATFWSAVTVALGKLHPLSGASDFRRVTYNGRRSFTQGDFVEDVVFTCPETNRAEAEIRLFWPVELPGAIQPFELHVPQVAEQCSLVSG